MKIVVTGALGHIGSRLIRDFAVLFPDVNMVMIDNMLTQRYCSLFNLPTGANYDFLEMDIIKDDLKQVFSGATAVVHLAAITTAAESFSLKQEIETINCSGTELVARACLATGTPLIFPSSTSVYTPQFQKIVDETAEMDDLNPQNPYAESKLHSERMLFGLGKDQGLQFAICRFGTIFGVSPGMRFHTAVNKFCWQASMGMPITVWRNALYQRRPYLDLGDAVNAIAHVINNKLFNNELFNVLTINLSVYDIIEIIGAHVPNISISYVDAAIMNDLSFDVSTDSFLRKGFSYSGNIRSAIEETIKLFRSRK